MVLLIHGPDNLNPGQTARWGSGEREREVLICIKDNVEFTGEKVRN